MTYGAIFLIVPLRQLFEKANRSLLLLLIDKTTAEDSKNLPPGQSRRSNLADLAFIIVEASSSCFVWMSVYNTFNFIVFLI